MCIHASNLAKFSALAVEQEIEWFRRSAEKPGADREWYLEEVDRLTDLLKLKAEAGEMV